MSRPAGPPRRAWRTVLLWSAFALTLLAGLGLALRHGGSAPLLVEVVGE